MFYELIIHDERLKEFGGIAPATPLSAGMDLRACIQEPVALEPGETVFIGTGISLCINEWERQRLVQGRSDRPVSYVVPCAVIMPRSGLGCRGVKPRNAPGLIDADYQGEITVCLVNYSDATVVVNPLDRIAQIVFMEAWHPMLKVVDEFSHKTERGEGGFGSTGSK